MSDQVETNAAQPTAPPFPAQYCRDPADVSLVLGVLSAGRTSYSKELRLGYLNCPFPCSSVAISTDLNCSEPNLVPAGPDCHWNSDR